MVQIHRNTSKKGKSTIACPDGANSLDGAHPIPSGANPLLSQIPEMEILHFTKITKFPRAAQPLIFLIDNVLAQRKQLHNFHEYEQLCNFVLSPPENFVSFQGTLCCEIHSSANLAADKN